MSGNFVCFECRDCVPIAKLGAIVPTPNVGVYACVCTVCAIVTLKIPDNDLIKTW